MGCSSVENEVNKKSNKPIEHKQKVNKTNKININTLTNDENVIVKKTNKKMKEPNIENNNSDYNISEKENENNDISSFCIINDTDQPYNDLNQIYKYYKTLQNNNEKITFILELKSGMIASGTCEGKIYIWIPEQDYCLKYFQEVGEVLCMLEMEKDKILSGTIQANIGLRDINNSNPDDFSFNFIGHSGYVNSLVQCNDEIFASASNDATIKIWDYYQRKEIRTIKGHEDCILTLIKLKNGNLCSGSADYSIKFWEWETGICLKEIKNAHKGYIVSLCEFENGILISGSMEKEIKIWKEEECIKELYGHENAIRIICKIDENLFVSGSLDNSIKIWNIKDFKCCQTLKGHTSNVTGIIKLSNNNLMSCSLDSSIKIWAQN